MKFCKLASFWGFIGGWLLVGLLLTGCKSSARFADLPGPRSPQKTPASATGPATAPGAATAAPMPALGAGSESIDILQVGDRLVITFSDLPPPPMTPIEERVREDGTIRLIQDQVFTAKGKYRGALEKEIRERYVPRFFKSMTVSVTPQNYSQFYYVDGEVKRPNRQAYLAQTTVLKAIASANGFTDFAKRTAVVLTRGDGRKFKINCIKAIEDPKLDLEVFPGDKIYVPRRINPFAR